MSETQEDAAEFRYAPGDFGMHAVAGYQVQRNNPLRPLSWRWQRAVHLSTINRRLTGSHDDLPTVNAARFLAATRAGRERAALDRDWPGLQEALALVDSRDPRQRWEVAARLLTGQDDNAIAARCGLASAAVHWFEMLFFNVRDRLAAHDWIATQAIGPGLWRGFSPNDLGGIWRAFGYNAGSLALDVVIPLTWDGLPIAPSANKSKPVGDEVVAAAAHRAILAMMVPSNADPLRLAELHLVLRRLETCPKGSQAARKAMQQATSILESLVALRKEDGRTVLQSMNDARIAPSAAEVKSDLGDDSTAARNELHDDRRDSSETSSSPLRIRGKLLGEGSGRKGVATVKSSSPAGLRKELAVRNGR